VTVAGGLDALLYFEALEQQWSLVHDIMAPGAPGWRSSIA
jgi:hypothetical protein